MKGEIFRSTPGRVGIIILLALMLAGAMLAAMSVGAMKLSSSEIFAAFRGDASEMACRIVRDLRLPRVLLGALAGAALAVSGALLQGVMRNPLASPGIIGVSSGAGLAAVLVTVAAPQFSAWLIPAAFAGALVAAVTVYLAAWRRGVSPMRLILAGVAVAAMVSACSSIIMLLNSEKAGAVLDFTVGTLSARGWSEVHTAWPYITFALAVAFIMAHRLNVLALGDGVAASLGLHVELTRFILLAVAALLAATAAATVGLLGFVGLIAPHIVRIFIGADNRFLLPGAALFGAFTVVACDAIGRIAAEPRELPVGVIMAVLGPMFFLYLLRRRDYGI